MIKNILIAVLVVVLAVLGYMSWNSGASVPFAGVSHLSGLNVGADGFSVDGATALTGTTTIASSPDGVVNYSSYTVATTSVAALYTNSGSPQMCDPGSAYIYADSTGYSPAFYVSLATSTSATSQVTAPYLIASTTLATTTDTIIPSALTTPFLLSNGSSIIGLLADRNGNASSTYFGNWTMQFGVRCWTLGQ